MEEMRRVDIVYFLSRKGSIEHPHLLRLHHLSRHGIRLRDVKRWLGEVRGKDMPDSFSWSYKRRYKTGYVWQDLLDDDLITPISDNEYVLKGSQISPSTKPDADFSYTDEQASKKKDQSCLREEKITLHEIHSSECVSAKSSSEIEESSPTFSSETSTLTDESIKLDMSNNASASTTKQEQNPSSSFKPKVRSSPFSSAKDKKKSEKVGVNENKSSTSSKTLPQATKLKGASSSSSSIFRNLISCGGVDTKDSAVVPINNRQKKPFLNMCPSDVTEVHSSASAEICKRDKLGGSQRVFGTPNWAPNQWSCRRSFDGVRDDASRAASAAAYKPVNGPSCSQCGKTFRPEKLHYHMKSCKGMKAAMAKATAEKAPSEASMEFKNRGSFSGSLLAH